MMSEEDDRTLVHLLTDQIEFADVVILNKVDDAGPEKTDAARKIIRSLNADAAKELYGFADHTPETEEYGVTSHVYRARRPFIPERVLEVLNGEMPGVIRAKGHFWISTRPDWVAEFSLAGALSSVKPLGTWWAAVPEERRPTHETGQSYLEAHWQEPWGDRRQEIVFIGSGIDWPALKERLDACLVPAIAATSPNNLPPYHDPFPVWGQAEAAA